MSQIYTPEQAAELNAKLDVIAKQVRKLFDQSEFFEAKKILEEQALALVPDHQIVLSDLAYCERKLGNFEQAHRYLMQILENHKEIQPDVYDSLVVVCFKMKRFEEARYYAKLSIKRKKEVLNEQAVDVFPLPEGPVPGLSSDKRKNVICFSLFGNLPRYCETAVLNVELAKRIYPEWTCRFYVDETVPKQVVNRLANKGADVIYVNSEQKKISGLFWRFFIFADPNVQCFIIRDADSMLSYKEKAAVDEWIVSGKRFHIMRDAIEHSELILAGMWGGYAGVFTNIENLIEKFYDKLTVRNKTIDQRFLRELYPTIAQSVLIHDNNMLDPESCLFPEYSLSDIEKIPYFHIGMIDSGMEKATFYLKEGERAKRVIWSLKKKEDDEIICFYEADVTEENGEFSVCVKLPYFYNKQITRQKWYFSYSILE